MQKVVKILLLALLVFIVIFLASSIISMILSPKPSAKVLNKMVFKETGKIVDKKAYEKAQDKVDKAENISYKSEFDRNTFDIYYPKNTKKNTPVMVWVHGGGYLGGDKSVIDEFATRICADEEIIVICPNYALAPEAQYPNHLHQLDDLIVFLKAKEANYPKLDLSKIFLGGDSAGAQIALQYALVQTNDAYASELGMVQQIDKEKLKGVLSYCGPLNVKDLAQEYGNKQAANFLISNVAWSIIGTKDWQNSPDIIQASLVEHLTEDFPPTYVTDGNFYSFEDQGIEFEERLKVLQVPVKSLFFIGSKQKIVHEYQFDYAKDPAKKCYQETKDFINTYKNAG